MGGVGAEGGTASRSGNYEQRFVGENPLNLPTYAGDTSQLGSFIKTGEGKQYAGLYREGDVYRTTTGAIYRKNMATGQYDPGEANDVSKMLQAYTAWTAGNAATQNNWQNYANAVKGQGEQATVLGGPAESQRQVLLGEMAKQTAPTSGLGKMGTMPDGSKKKLGSI